MNKNNKKILIAIIAIVAVIVLLIVLFSNIGIEKIDENSIQNEIVPEEEISDEQFRETTIGLYYLNEKNEIACEIKKVDSKKLLEDPYTETITYLLEGPKHDNLKSAIPKNTRVNKVEKDGDCLIIDFSKEFVDEQAENTQMHGLVINQIVETMTQFTEINRVKITIEGKSDLSFKNGNINFKQIFTKEFKN